jgi:lysozyme family protein
VTTTLRFAVILYPPAHHKRAGATVSFLKNEDEGGQVTIDVLIDAVIDREGGYSDNPADRGGPTRFGITQAVARAQGYTGDMRLLPRATAAAIYRRLYWVNPRFDAVAERAPTLAAELFDTGVNMGPAVAASFLQRALNALNRGANDYPDIAVDGAIGAQTLAALDAFLKRRGAAGAGVLTKAIDALQGARYLQLAETRPADEAFLYGWLDKRVGGAGA